MPKISKERLESSILTDVLSWLKAKGIFHWRVPLGPVLRGGGKDYSKNPMKGFPDIAGIAPGSKGRLFAIEVKRPKGRFSQEQLDWQTKLEEADVLYIQAYSLDDVEEAFDDYA